MPKRNKQEPTTLSTRKMEIVQTFGNIAGLYRGKNDKDYFAWKFLIVGPSENPATPRYRISNIRLMRKTTIVACIKEAAEATERGELKESDLEQVLDRLYAELSRRSSKDDARIQD